MRYLTEAEKAEYAYHLEDFHKVFYTFWEISKIALVDDPSIPTIAVMLPTEERQIKPTIIANKDFWDKSTFKERLFYLIHECKHVMLEHGLRIGKDECPGATRQQINIAQDVTINEMIKDLYKFPRHEIRNWKKYCWLDTTFKDDPSILPNQPFIYYLKKLMEKQKQQQQQQQDGSGQGQGGKGEPGDGQPQQGDGSGDNESQTVDVHGEDMTPEQKEALEKLAGILNKMADKEQRDAMKKATSGTKAGAEFADQLLLPPEEIKPSKINFQKFVHDLAKTSMTTAYSARESFATENRRYSDFLAQNRNIQLPGIHESYSIQRQRLDTVLFMDVSGSCISMVPQFRQAAASFLYFPKVFKVKGYTFDTQVREVDFRQHIRGGGGTAFHILEAELRRLPKYPDCVIVVTDGEGTHVNPLYPDRWVWLLGGDSTRRLIPEKCKVFNLDEIVFLK